MNISIDAAGLFQRKPQSFPILSLAALCGDRLSGKEIADARLYAKAGYGIREVAHFINEDRKG
jgi:hypothetical protein